MKFFSKIYFFPQKYFLKLFFFHKISKLSTILFFQKNTKKRHFLAFFDPAGRPPEAQYLPTHLLGRYRRPPETSRGGIISTPKIDFRTKKRPAYAGNSACFDLLKFRRPLRLYIKMVFQRI